MVGHTGRWIGSGLRNNTFFSSTSYSSKGPVIRCDSPAPGSGYIIDGGVGGRYGTGCYLTGATAINIVTGNRAGYVGTYACVTNRLLTGAVIRQGAVIYDTLGDGAGYIESYPLMQIYGATARRMSDTSFAYAGFLPVGASYQLIVGTGHVRDGSLTTAPFRCSDYRALIANSDWDAQHVLPVRWRDDRFAVIFLGVSGAQTTPYLKIVPNLPIANSDLIVGICTTATPSTGSLITIQAAQPILSGFSSLPIGGLMYHYSNQPYSYSGYGNHPDVKALIGVAISTTQIAPVMNRRGW
jgi:hypothetical protein